MSRRKALVKRLSAVETLGATTVILTDKTGTLTENQMSVREIWTSEVHEYFQGDEASSRVAIVELLRTAALCCDAHVNRRDDNTCQVLGDPTEAAILMAAAQLGLTSEKLATWPRLAELPFDSIRKRMTTIQMFETDAVACVKGAPSEIFARCTTVRHNGADPVFDANRRQAAEAAQKDMAGRGLRVLAVASRAVDPSWPTSDGWRVEDVEHDLTLLGLLAIEDPPRREVPDAIAACRRAGIRVVMVTGDDGLTAEAIGREIGLHKHSPRIVTGAELDHLGLEGIMALFDTSELLFARVSPEHKLRLVEACQQRREVVAVTGDGVNDAPALKRADIGVAMGETGTDVARQAADMVLADDNFASIVAAIEQGRAVYDNVRKFVTYIFASNMPEIVPFIAFVLFGIPLPLTVMQILAVDLGTDLLPALALGAEPPEPDVMWRQPRARSERLLDLFTLLRAYGWLGMIEAILSLGGYFFAFWLSGWRPGMPLAATGPTYVTATTMTLAGIVVCQVGNIFACRSNRQSVLQLGLASNPLVFIGIAYEFALLLLLLYAPPLMSAFGTGPLERNHWLVLAVFGPLLLFLEEIRKGVRARLCS
jgi:calcium-translocating P-type ATPase